MTIVTIKCPHCEQDVSIIIEVGDKQSYECHKCHKKFTAISSIEIVKH